jgi:C4-dicarboxylate-specific signal transduction histidine kinase
MIFYFYIEIKDSGTGVQMRLLSIFEPLLTTKTLGEGTGLG